MIDQISKSTKWNKFNKSDIIDSLKSIRFLVIDSTKYSEMSQGSLACFIDLGRAKTKFASKFLDKPNENGIIAVRSDAMKLKNLPSILVHELYHYVDKLNSNSIKLSRFVDRRLRYDKKLAIKKSLSLLLSNMEFDPESITWSDKYEEANDYVQGHWIKNWDYFTSDDELFARWMAIKSEMLKSGFITDIQKKIKFSDMSGWYQTLKGDDKSEFENLMFFLDWSKIDQIDSQIFNN